MKKKVEWKPWYRKDDYDGNLSEAEKRHLDSFRMDKRHPAAELQELPEEVQEYIRSLELDFYDLKQDGVVKSAFAFAGLGVLVTVCTYYGFLFTGRTLSYALGIVVIIVSWIWYLRTFRRNSDKLFMRHEGSGIPFSRSDEAIQKYWELEEIERFRKKQL